MLPGEKKGPPQAPIRHPIDWKSPSFYQEEALLKELERVYDICHSCRRCVNLCHAFPTLFDLIDHSETEELDGVDKQDYWKVTEHCYLCDLCYMTKCPYVPPHEWNVDFPHLMLRAKAHQYRQGKTKLRDKLLSSTDQVGSLAGIPIVAHIVNVANKNTPVRKAMEKIAGISAQAKLPEFHSRSHYKQIKSQATIQVKPLKTPQTSGKVAIFASCYGKNNNPILVKDLRAIYEHNKIQVRLVEQEKCCGMPKLELGALEAVEKLKRYNIPALIALVEEGWDLIAPIPSCVLMFKQELPLLFAEDKMVKKIGQAFFDPFEYLMLRHKQGLLNTDFRNALGTIAYHAACHQRVQNMGPKTRELLQLIPDTKIVPVERCSGHDGSYAVKREYHATARKICQPIVTKIKQIAIDHYISDCPMAGNHIQHCMADDQEAESPFGLLRHAYGI